MVLVSFFPMFAKLGMEVVKIGSEEERFRAQGSQALGS